MFFLRCCLVVLGTLLFASPGLAQSPFSDCIVSVNNATITFSMTSSITFPDGSAIESGDEIALYTSSGACAGVTVWSESSDNTVAAAGKSGSVADDEGFGPEDQIMYRIWDTSTDITYRATGVDYVNCSDISIDLCRDDGLFETDAVYFPESFFLVLLPVELSEFTARPVGDRVRVSWTTASELNNAGFEVQIRSDEGPWRILGFVGGSGTTAKQQRYELTTDRLEPNRYGFRLRQIDLDGTAQFSPVTNAVLSPEVAHLTVPQPNPISRSGTLRLSVANRQQTRIVLYDLLGRRVRVLFDGTVSPSRPVSVQVDGSALAAGMYFVIAKSARFTLFQRVMVID